MSPRPRTPEELAMREASEELHKLQSRLKKNLDELEKHAVPFKESSLDKSYYQLTEAKLHLGLALVALSKFTRQHY